MKRLFFFFVVLTSAVLLYQCGGPKAKEIKELKEYKDELRKFAFEYPADWYFVKTPTGAVVFTSKDEMKRFYNYDTEGPATAKIEIIWDDTYDTLSMEDVLKKYRRFEESTYTPFEKFTLGGYDGLKSEYAFKLKDGTFNGMQFIAAKDTTTATVFIMECFANAYEKYKPHFDKIIASVQLAETPAQHAADTVFEVVEAPPPSDTLKVVFGEGYSLEVPQNFNKERGLYMGQRRGDSYIRVDVLDASKQKDLGKIIAASKDAIPGASDAQNVTLGGVNGKKLTYKPSNTVDGEMYWVIKGDKLYRITLNWFKGEAKDYKPVFLKSVQTFKFEN